MGATHISGALEQAGLQLDVSDQAPERLANAGFDPACGARPLKQVIQSELENPLAQKILGGDFTPGETIHVDAVDGRFVFSGVLEGEVVNG